MKIKLSKEPWELNDYKIEYNNPITSFDISKVSLHLEPEQKDGYIKGNILAERLKDKSLNSTALKYLLDNPKLIPEAWKGKYVYFWGTIYRDADGFLYVRCLDWRGGRWVSDYRWLGGGWGVSNPSALLASPKSSDPESSLSLSALSSRVEKLEDWARKLNYKN
jgi:hypothetical protein